MKYKKKIVIYLIGILFLALFMIKILDYIGFLKYIQILFGEYIDYVNKDIEHRAKLYESIIGSLFTGVITFVALFITILHENKKDRVYWKREREKEREERLLSVRPFLHVEVKSVSVSREGNCEDKDFVLVGNGRNYQYAHIVLLNCGYGRCMKIALDGRECSVGQLDINSYQDFDIYFMGIKDEEPVVEFEMTFCYEDIFGNPYLQKFDGSLNIRKKELDIQLGKTLIGRK